MRLILIGGDNGWHRGAVEVDDTATVFEVPDDFDLAAARARLAADPDAHFDPSGELRYFPARERLGGGGD